MKKIVFILAIGVAGWYWHQGELPFLAPAGAFDNSGNPVVWLFTVDDCGNPCDSARNQLKRRRVDFEEKVVDIGNGNDDAYKFWKRVGRNSFPVIAAGDEVSIGPSRSALASVLGLNFGDRYLTGTEQRLFKTHFYPDGSPKIVMYGADWCLYCKKLRTEFRNDDVDFIEIDVDRSPRKETIMRTMEIHGYPATWVGYTRVNGSTLKAVNKALRSY